MKGQKRMTLRQWLRVFVHRAKKTLSGKEGCIDPENLLPPEKITLTGGRIIRSRSKLIDGTVYRVHSVFRKDGSLPKRLLTLMENDSKNTSYPPSENIPDPSVKSLDFRGNM